MTERRDAPRCSHPDCRRTVLCDGLRTCSQHVEDELGITYRQMDHWVRQGYLRPLALGGSGAPRSWPPAELEVARRMASLIGAGLTVTAAAEAARRARPAVAEPNAHPAGRSRRWMSLGRCAESDPELFFPEASEPWDAARAICRGCEVREECLEFALEHFSEEGVGWHGIWGGTSHEERQDILAARLLEGAAA